jgi:signal transduction histidine kinase
VKVAWRSVKRQHVHAVVVIAGVVAGLLAVLGAVVNPYHAAAISLLINTPIEVAVGWSFLFVGLIAGRRRPENRIGLLMSLFGLTWFAYALQWIHVPLPYYIGDTFRQTFLVVLAHLYIVYPRGRPAGKLERGAIASVYVWFLFTILSQTPTSDPVAQGCRQCLANPFYIPGTAWLNPAARAVSEAGTVFAAIVVLVVFFWHWRQASAPLRRAMTPAAWAALPVFAVVVAFQLDGAGLLPAQLGGVLGPFEWLTFAILPVGLLIGVLRTRLGRAAVTDFVVELNRIPTRSTLRDSMARALGDPSLELALALPNGDYVDSDGRALVLPSPGSGRAVTALESNGKPLAALIHDPAVDEEDPGLVAAAGSAARLALENERLQAEVRASLEEVRASRARILEAADAERRRLERDIHDGAQQRLVALGLALRLARDQAATHADKGLVKDLDGAANELKQALSELRDLAQGIHPAVLSRAGIGPALRVLAELSPIPVEIKDAPLERYPESVEATAYFVVSEALANAAKHSGAGRVEVSVRREGERLCVEVQDDGLGGANPGKGSGLIGMADRVAVLGGRLEVASPSGAGTLVHAEIPCG